MNVNVKLKKVITMKAKSIKRKLVKRSMLLAGLSMLIIALILSFVSIQRVNERYVSEEKILDGGGDFKTLETRYTSINSTLEMEFNPNNNEVNEGNITVSLKDRDYNLEDNITVPLNETKTIQINGDEHWIVSNFNSSIGSLSYRQIIVFERQPYGILSLPAFVLTIIGIVVVYNGKHEMNVEKILKEQEKKRKEMDESEQDDIKPDFMGVDWGKKD